MPDSDNAYEQTEQMFALVGRAITRWSFVEDDLCRIFSICLSPVCAHPEGGLEFLDSYVPLSAFYSIESLRGKLSLVDSALTSRLVMAQIGDGELAKEWARLKDKIRKLSLKRNRLAHWTVLPAFTYEGVHPPRLVPPFGSPAYFRETGLNRTNQTLKPLHVEHLERAFFLLSEKLRVFAFKLARQEELFDRYARLLARQIRSLDRTDPTRAERLRRALSSEE